MLNIKPLIGGALLLTAPAISHASVMYSLVDLGTLDTSVNFSEVSDINNNGTLTGYSYSNYDQTPFYYSESNGMQAFSGINGNVTAINDNGVAAGMGSNGFVTNTNGNATTLNPLNGGFVQTVSDINNNGIVVGASTDAAYNMRATSWDAATGTATDLGSLDDATADPYASSQANAVNSNGQIVGSSSKGWDQAAVMWENGTITELSSLDGETTSSASAINDAGTIVGTSGMSAVLWDSGSVFTIDNSGYSTANDINNAGFVVGEVSEMFGMFGYLWSADSGLTLLDDLLLGAEGWSVSQVFGINDDNWIAANATYSANGEYFSRGVLLKPEATAVSAPATLGILCLGMLAMFRRRILPSNFKLEA